MGCLGKILWFLCGGAIGGLCWMAAGLLWCITIVGIPVGVQCFKFAGLTFFPFGKEVEYGGGPMSFLVNIIWVLVTGIPMALEHLTFGIILCITKYSLGEILISKKPKNCFFIKYLYASKMLYSEIYFFIFLT